MSCSICLSTIYFYHSKKLSCHHKFHNECITLWKNENNSCPICRTPFDDIYLIHENLFINLVFNVYGLILWIITLILYEKIISISLLILCIFIYTIFIITRDFYLRHFPLWIKIHQFIIILYFFVKIVVKIFKDQNDCIKE